MQFEFCGADVYYEDMGKGNAAVLLHGWGGSSRTMKCVANALYDMRVISFDFPPFGNSSEPPCDWSLSTYSNMVIACLKSLGIEKASFIGHSFGGRVCIDIASRTDMADRVVLVDAAGLRPKLTLKKLINKFRFRLAKKRGKDTSRFYSPDYKALSENMRAVFSRVVSEDLTGRLKDIKSQTLIIWGKDDKETPMYMARKLHRKISGSGLVVLDGGHFAYLDNLSEFLVIIRAFIGN